MVRSIVIARSIDGLPLAASMDDEELDRDYSDYKNQIKQVLKSLSSTQTEPMCTINAGAFSIHIVNNNGVSYLAICDKSYPKQLAFKFLDEIQHNFTREYPWHQIEAISRPYAFLKFDSVIQRTKRAYKDIRSQHNLSRLQDELLDVSNIMTSNIKDVLERGNKLEQLNLLSETLSQESKRYLRDARQLNLDALYRKYGAPSIVLSIVFVCLWLWLKWF